MTARPPLTRRVLNWSFLLALTAGMGWIALRPGGIGLLILIQLLVVPIIVIVLALYCWAHGHSFRAAFRAFLLYGGACMAVAYASGVFHDRYGDQICYWPPAVISDEEVATIVFKELVGDNGRKLQFGKAKKLWHSQDSSLTEFNFVTDGATYLVYEGVSYSTSPFLRDHGERARQLWLIGIERAESFERSERWPDNETPVFRNPFQLVHPCGRYAGSHNIW